jgi:hypothetical protein
MAQGALSCSAGATGGWYIDLEDRKDAEIPKKKSWRSLRLCDLPGQYTSRQ